MLMKCRVCRQPAVIKVPRHNAAFCAVHYREHIHRQIERTIKKFRMFTHDDRVLIGVSGGKDSMALWKALLELGYQVQAVHLNNGFGEFSEKSESVVRSFAEAYDAPLEVFHFGELYGFSFHEALRVVKKPVCSLCGIFKRYSLNQLARELGCQVVVTGHNLDDETAFLMGNVLHWQLDYLKRQYPVLEAEPGMVKKVKPAVRVTDKELRDYAEICGVDFVTEKCPHARGATSHFYKKVLEQLEDEYPGTKANFYFGFVDRLSPLVKGSGQDLQPDSFCSECGYKTLLEGKCFVCTLKERIKHGG